MSVGLRRVSGQRVVFGLYCIVIWQGYKCCAISNHTASTKQNWIIFKIPILIISQVKIDIKVFIISKYIHCTLELTKTNPPKSKPPIYSSNIKWPLVCTYAKKSKIYIDNYFTFNPTSLLNFWETTTIYSSNIKWSLVVHMQYAKKSKKYIYR